MIDKHPGQVVSSRIYEALINTGDGSPPDEENQPTIRVAHHFVPSSRSAWVCNICEGVHSDSIHIEWADPESDDEEPETEKADPTVNRDWSRHHHFQGMSPRELEHERKRALRKIRRRKVPKLLLRAVGAFVTVAILSGVALFLLDAENTSSRADPPKTATQPTLDWPSSDTQLRSFEEIQTAPAPTLTAGQIFELNDEGELSNDQAAALLVSLWTEEAAPESVRIETAPAGQPVAATNIRTIAPPTPLRGSAEWIAVLESKIHDLINLERRDRSLGNLDHDSILAETARYHSQDMASNDYFSHDNLEGQSPTDRGNLVGYQCRKDYESYYTEGLAENLFQGYLYGSETRRAGIIVSKDYHSLDELAELVVEGWMNSLGHRENILTPEFDSQGVGIAVGNGESVYVTQDFC
jgi:uncharacterized protein YkwD